MAHSGSRRGSRSGTGRLALAQLLLFFIGMIAMFTGAFAMRDADQEASDLIGIVSADAKPTDGKLITNAQNELAAKFRIAGSVDMVIGVIFAACAVLVNRLPVIATVTGLTLYLAALAVVATIDIRMFFKGFFVRVLVIIALTASVTAALRMERRRNARRRLLAEDYDQ